MQVVLELVGDIVGWLIVAGILAVSGWVAQRVVRSLFRGPVRHALIRVVADGKEITGVRGLIDGPPTVRAPLTGEPCALATTSITSAAQYRPVWQSTAAGDIRVRHAQLLYHTALQASFERQRAELDVEIEQIMQRYRDLKASDAPGARVALDLPPAPKQ